MHISRAERMTRTAISPRLAISIFWSTGANVGAVTSLGDIWSETAWPAGWDVRHVAETGSTNTDLLDAVVRGAAGARTVLAADHQTAGRGRLDRRWDAPPGTNLLVSIAFVPVPAVPAHATQRVGLAAVAAVRAHLPGATVGLKWPNDVLLDGAKLGGILAQRSAAASSTGAVTDAATGAVTDAVTDAVVVGIGLNVGWAPAGAASLDGAVTPPELLARLLAELDALPADITGLYRSELLSLGVPVRVELPRGELLGTAVDVGDDGRLAVRDDRGVVHRLDVGDVVHLRTH